MNVYDFDKTIYDGDSTLDFYIFAVKKNLFLLKYLPKQFLGMILYYLKIINKEKYKESFFSFLKGIKNIDVERKKIIEYSNNPLSFFHYNFQGEEIKIIHTERFNFNVYNLFLLNSIN